MISRVCWNITNRCNDNCAFCFRDQLSSELTLNQNRLIANKLIASGIKHIAFSGGEALLYEGLLDLIQLFSFSNIEITLISNSLLLDGSAIDEYSKYINWLALPIDTLIGNRKISRNMSHLDNVLQLLSYAEKTPL